MTTMKTITLAGALLAASCAIASAQPAPTMRVKGTIEKVDGNVLTLKTADGEAKLTLTGNAPGRRRGQSLDGGHQGEHLPRQRGDAAAGRHAEGAGGAHLPRGDARHRRRASAVHHSGQHHDQRHGGRRDGDGRRWRGHQGQIQGRREGDRRPAERADRPLRDRQRRPTSRPARLSPCWPRPRSRTARWRRPASTSAATGWCRSSIRHQRLAIRGAARNASSPSFLADRCKF